VLTCVFARFLEDNRLVDPPKLSGPGERLRRARDEHELYFHATPKHTDREYLLAVFDGLAGLPSGQGIFAGHNPIRQQPGWLSGDAARAILTFFQRIEPESGNLAHDFADPQWDTRFLGDLYQDLSEAARKKYALLQTPEFVEEFILDRTLDPAIEEFGLDGFRMIDPACGSGHFLLGSFRRLAERWRQAEPATNDRELVQRALDSVHGVDLNPYAVAIARFRLLLAAMRACGVERLADAPSFRMNLVCGDSLLHGSSAGDQLVLGFHELAHAYQSEDLAELRRILRPGTYHAVVANPPYITPKDKALNQAYRERYSACHRQYSLAVPFMQRLFDLAVSGRSPVVADPSQPAAQCGQGTPAAGAAGYVGQITANSFMKREFGKKLIEQFLPTVDLTHLIDTSGAYIPGHGTPTVILFGRTRRPVTDTIRTVMGIRGEPTTPEVPSRGLVWSAIVAQIDHPGSQSGFVSVVDSQRESFQTHPRSIGGGGAAELKEVLCDSQTCTLQQSGVDIGYFVISGEDNCLLLDLGVSARRGLSKTIPLVDGELVRDWMSAAQWDCVWPNTSDGARLTVDVIDDILHFLWSYRTTLKGRKAFGTPIEERGIPWWAIREVYRDRLRTPLSIVYAEVATHNHFVLDRGGKVFKQTAPVIKLPPEATDDGHFGLLGLLNSSTACFWLKQVCQPKGSSGIGRGVYDEAWEKHFAFNATSLAACPLPGGRPAALTRQLDAHARALATHDPSAVLAEWSRAVMDEQRAEAASGESLFQRSMADDDLELVLSARDRLKLARKAWETLRGHMIASQEELDWQCYRLYGLVDEDLTLGEAPPAIALGQRAFEIVMARKMAAGELQTTWFDRHGSTPITEIPADWPADYRRLVERRIEAIESNPQIALIEQPEYKRRWNTEPWDSQLERALREWLLGRLESYFDFDGRMNDRGEPTAKLDPALISTARLADIAARDAGFMQVAEIYRGRQDFDIGRLVAELVEDECVPLLPVLRYKPSGLDKRQAWERTWELQRQEDAIDARTKLPPTDPNYLTEEQTRAEKRTQVGEIPVPPKYASADFLPGPSWRLRGKLDVPKERWVSFPHCEGEDGTLVIAWAGLDHLQLARAVSGHLVEVQDKGGSTDPRLVPLLGGILELVPWLKQWHNDPDPEFNNMRMGDYFDSFVEQEARTLGLTVAAVRAWQPPKKAARRGAKTQRAK